MNNCDFRTKREIQNPWRDRGLERGFRGVRGGRAGWGAGEAGG